VQETLSRLRSSSLKLKKVLRKSATAAVEEQDTLGSGSRELGSGSAVTPRGASVKAANTYGSSSSSSSSSSGGIEAVGDTILSDLLLLDTNDDDDGDDCDNNEVVKMLGENSACSGKNNNDNILHRRDGRQLGSGGLTSRNVVVMDFDLFVLVESHYMRSLQRTMFAAWCRFVSTCNDNDR
jgi:hypothetical protein